VAVLAVRDGKPKKRGPKTKWSIAQKIELVAGVEDGLRANGWKRRNRKAVVRVIDALRQTPFWAKFDPSRLRTAYYDNRELGLRCLESFAEWGLIPKN
jgi:hypothetical protein